MEVKEPINLYNVDKWKRDMFTPKEEELYQKFRARLSTDQFTESDLVFEIHPIDGGYKLEYTEGYGTPYFLDMSSEVEIDDFIREYIEDGRCVYQRTERGLDLIPKIA